MTNEEAILAVKNGDRCITLDTMSDFPNKPDKCVHLWRLVACNQIEDVDECRYCGLQKISKCNFDEECS